MIREAEAALADEDLSRALPLLHDAEALGVEADRCAGNRWLAYMLGGDFAAAWRESDAIRLRGAPDPHRFWNGEAIDGKRLMLRSLHGFGDAVQMFRFLPRLRERVSELIVEVPPRMVEIAPCFAGMGEVITWGEHAPKQAPAWDVQAEVMELPYMLRVDCDDLEPRQGYLRLPSAVRDEVSRVVGPRVRRRVGVVWTAGHWNPSRSIPVELLRGLAGVRGVEFWSLEARHGGPEHANVPFPGWRDAYEAGDGIVRLAAVIERMDLVITVDTLAAHLAGALGVPCWVLLQHRADWRWMAGRETSPWYPSLRLWRQAEPGDWRGLMERVAAARWQKSDAKVAKGPLRCATGCVRLCPTCWARLKEMGLQGKLSRTWDAFDGYLFDIDGTLLNCKDAVHYFAFCDALTEVAGRPLNLDGVVTHGNVDAAILRDAFARGGVDEAVWRPRLDEIRAVHGRAGGAQPRPVADGVAARRA